MDANAKKWVNRGGLIAMLIGVVLVIVGGGDVQAALAQAGVGAAIIGAILVFVREALG